MSDFIEEMKKKLGEAEAKEKILKASLGEVNEDRIRLKEELIKKQSEIDRLTSMLKTYEENVIGKLIGELKPKEISYRFIEDLIERLEKRTDELLELKEKMYKTAENEVKLYYEIEKKDARIKELLDEVYRLKMRAPVVSDDAVIKDLNEKIKSLESIIRDKDREIESIKTAGSVETSKELEELKKELVEKKDLIDSLNETINKLESELKNEKERCANLESEISKLSQQTQKPADRERVLRLEERISILSEENNNLRKKIKELAHTEDIKEKFVRYMRALKNLKDKLASVYREGAGFVGSYKELKEREEKLAKEEAKLHELRTRYEQLLYRTIEAEEQLTNMRINFVKREKEYQMRIAELVELLKKHGISI